MVTVCPSQFATRRTLFHVLVGCGLLMLKVSRLKDRKSGSAGMPRPISYAVFCLKKKNPHDRWINGEVERIAMRIVNLRHQRDVGEPGRIAVTEGAGAG